MGSFYDSFIYKAYSKALYHITHINWNWIDKKINGSYYNLTEADHNDIRAALAKNYFIIGTRRNNFMSTYLIMLAHFVKTGKKCHYSHVLLNLEEDDPATDEHYQLYESTSKGVGIGTFKEVFDVDSVVLLRPKNISIEEWHYVVEQVKKDIGKPYDDFFKINDDTHLSCVELIRNGLKKIPDYDKKFANFEAEIAKAGNLTPEMYYTSKDFEIVYEIRR